ncbi:makorin, ring finger protein, 4 isoform X2 [Syngnathoides biaculeatus]|uniref:makorin, ring finger protein, 4 isoform X2 n=1 Tax=Syngnathoides biaculeatus TaxID=300417 RepID=UPI002ADDA1FF|nr:makorin, ring finger protein, 4 isoform X2 [Syngnathoides biaculeatus]
MGVSVAWLSCRHFLNGSCRYGSRCHYRHELPAAPPSQICRYFQKGACWYGERCRYIHVPQPESGADVAGHRLSVPTVSPSTFSSSVAAQGSSDRRVSEASALAQADVLPRRQRRTLRSVENSSNVPDAWNQNAEKRLQDIPSRISGKRSEQSCASPHEKEENLPGSMEAAGAAAASSADGTSEAFLQSRDVTCGICMDKVYDKLDRSNQVFGILPNCSHAFCLQCIMTWRKTRDLGADVVKTCPQCRVRSAFYVPNKYWVEGQAKENLIADFKEKFRKRSCSYYARNKHCPFETECLFRHDRSARRRSFLCNTDDDDDYDDDDDDDDEDYDGLLNFFIAMTLLRSEEDDDDNDDDDDDDNFDIPFFLAQYGF